MSAWPIFFFKSDLFVSYLVFKTNPLASMLFALTTNLSYTVFLRTLLLTTLLSLIKSIEALFDFSTSIWPISAFKPAKSNFATNLEG